MKNQTRKRLIISLLTIFLLSIFINPLTTVQAEALAPDIEAKYAILIDGDTGRVLYEKNADVAAPIASMTKMMTEYLVLEAIDDGKISWDDTTVISDYAYAISNPSNGFSGAGLTQSKPYLIEDLYNAMAIYSDNAASIALAELVAGTEANFVKMMNEKAAELGLPDSHFENSTGLTNQMLEEVYPAGRDINGDNILSAESVALLAFSLIRDYPVALEHSSIPQMNFEGKKLNNWNWMLKHDPAESPNFVPYYYEGMDGLKTGYTSAAGKSFTGTAVRNGQRLISVVMNTTNEGDAPRFVETKKLLDHGFNNFEKVEIFPKGFQLKGQEKLKVLKGKEKEVDIETNKPISILINKGEDKSLYEASYVFDKSIVSKDKEVTAPIKKGEKVGSMKLSYKGDSEIKFITQKVQDVVLADLVTKNEVEKTNWFVLMMRGIGGFFGDIWSSVANTVKGWF
ncbi:D-alanyl-D-alanine carboxypeptidase family protein [Bacillus sp. JJ1521]|uniref:D-alanyl-D-alanine carboxypeptidase family protein n=1 Tax=Bacillus sp. JJ1521 TaxID=3122957 RepID=UPI003000302D